MSSLLQQVQQTIQDYQMLARGHTLLVAVSGGPDSMVLLHTLWHLREPLALKLCVAHLNHQMRPSAAEDALFVEATAHDLGLRCICKAIDVPTYQRQRKLSPEDAARQVRYTFLRATAAQLGADRIAVGHTADDQAETVLLHLLRGSGLRGLGGILPVRAPIIRPLIRVLRRDVLEYLRTHRLPFREDPTNDQRRYTRNRIRLDLLPALQQRYNPRLVQALCTTAQLLADDEAALQAVSRQRFLAARRPAAPEQSQLTIDALTPLPPALQRRILREALTEVMGSLQGVTHTHIAAILALLRAGAGNKWLRLPRGVVVERRYGVLLIHRQVPLAAVDVDVPLPVPGVCRVEALGVTLVSDLFRHDAVAGPFPTGEVAWLDADRVGQDARVRTRRPGDRLQPLGSIYVKKLKAFLIDAKVPRAARDRLPLVVTSAGIAWVAGVRPAEWAKVTPATRLILRLQVLRHAPRKAVDAVLEHT
ncbi:MAG: tRNA lysidine(34) synthetase TilS [Candidatus Entotheonellia bacterium]